jgi:hypothetical protein
MAEHEYPIRITARVENVTEAFARVSRAGQRMAQETGSSIGGLKGQSDAASKGVAGVGTAFAQAAKQADAAGRSGAGFGSALARAGNQGENAVGAAARALMGARQQTDAATKSARGLDAAFGSVKEKLAVGMAVGALQVLSSKLIEGGNEANLLGAKLEASLKSAGQTGALQDINRVSMALAALTGGDDDEIGAKLGGGIASGKLRSLQELGIYLNDAEQASIKAASSQGELAEATARTNAVLSAARRTVENLANTTPEAAQKLGEFAVAWGNTSEIVGQGAAEMRASWQSALTPLLQGLQESNPELVKFAGGVVEAANVTATAVSPLWALVDAALAIKNAKNLSRLATLADAEATAAATIATKANTAANIENARFSVGVGGKAGLLKGAAAVTGVGLAAFAGLKLGEEGAEQIRAAQKASGDEGAADSFDEMQRNAAGRLGFGAINHLTGARYDYDHMGKGAHDEAKSMAIFAKMKARRAEGSAAKALGSALTTTPTTPTMSAPLASIPFATASTSSASPQVGALAALTARATDFREDAADDRQRKRHARELAHIDEKKRREAGRGLSAPLAMATARKASENFDRPAGDDRAKSSRNLAALFAASRIASSYDLGAPPSRGGGGQPFSGGYGGRARSGQPQVQSMGRNSAGDVVVQFAPLVFKDGMQQLVGELGKYRP